MAATARNAALLLAAVLSLPVCAPADPASDVRAELGRITTALSDGNPSEAISVFEKSFRNYQKLDSYFQALISEFQVGSEIDINDETDDSKSVEMNVTWTLTLTDQTTGYSERRTSEEHVRFQLIDEKWKIVDLSPLDLFNPE